MIFTAALLFGNLFLTSALGVTNWNGRSNSNTASNSTVTTTNSQSTSVTIANSNKAVVIQSTPKPVQQVVSVPQGSGQGLVAGRAYKFADNEQVYVFDGRKLNKVSGVSTPINPMPSFVRPDSSIFGN